MKRLRLRLHRPLWRVRKRVAQGAQSPTTDPDGEPS